MEVVDSLSPLNAERCRTIIMRTLCYYAFTSVTLAAVFAGTIGAASADEKAGVTRISDFTVQQFSEPNTLPVIRAGMHRTYYSGVGTCESGNCNGISNGCQTCGSNGSGNRFWNYHTGPVIHPTVRKPAGYERWLPAVSYGDPRFGVPKGSAVPPMIYMPTDTTQLGYYYHRVPTWMPNPSMIPRYPDPTRFHRFDRRVSRNCGCNGNGNCGCGAACRCGSSGGCGNGACANGGYGNGCTNGGCGNGFIPQTQPGYYPTPAKKADPGVPPKPGV